MPAFVIDVADFEVLWSRLMKLFEPLQDGKRIYTKIDVSLPSESIKFDDVAELKAYNALPAEVRKFSIYCSAGSRTVSMRLGLISGRQTVSATAPDEAWCAGAIEVVQSFFLNHRAWYHRLVSLPLFWVFIAMAYVPGIIIYYFAQEIVIDRYLAGGYLLAVLSLAFLGVFRNKLFPATRLVIRKEETWIKRHSAEISLATALVSIIVAVVGILIKRG